MPSPLSAYALTPRELNELKAHHMACSHLIKGCQDAAIRLRRLSAGSDASRPAVELRAVEILEDVLGTWCDTLAVLRANLGRQQQSPAESALPQWLVGGQVVTGRSGRTASIGATQESRRA